MRPIPLPGRVLTIADLRKCLQLHLSKKTLNYGYTTSDAAQDFESAIRLRAGYYFEHIPAEQVPSSPPELSFTRPMTPSDPTIAARVSGLHFKPLPPAVPPYFDMLDLLLDPSPPDIGSLKQLSTETGVPINGFVHKLNKENGNKVTDRFYCFEGECCYNMGPVQTHSRRFFEHMDKYHGIKSFLCSRCGKGFGRDDYRNTHQGTCRGRR
ncbi:hypothetical protein ABW19_dt0201876 [Dactylella cylindrospora]|nr:hypothetical protein ABW19_dt0201876 [Dactylella cylindrospora]